MSSVITHDGEVVDKMSDTRYRVKLHINDKIVLAYSAGKIKQRYIKVEKGDKVRLEMSPFNIEKARIVYRYKRFKNNESQIINQKKKQ